MTKTFKHSGDMGDIIYSIPTIQRLGGGILYLDPTGGDGDEFQPFLDANRWRDGKKVTKFNQKSIDFLLPLLKVQKCLDEVVVWDGQEVDYNLNQHRTLFRTHHPMNLAEQHRKAFGVSDRPWVEKTLISVLPPWLDIPVSGDAESKAIVSRSLRYHSQMHVWNGFFDHNWDGISDGVFIGTDLEHEVFNTNFCPDPLPKQEVKDALEMAQAIHTAPHFWGNQSLPFALAMGAGSPSSWLEVCAFAPNTLFQREKVFISSADGGTFCTTDMDRSKFSPMVNGAMR